MAKEFDRSEYKQAAFMGRLTAGVTHEFKNVLAIIKETSGLMEDLLSLTDSSFKHKDRFSKALVTIKEQVDRGVELSTKLNRLAHDPDTEEAQVDLPQILEQTVYLSRRFARISGVKLKADSSETAVSLTGNPLSIRMAIFSALECCWQSMEKDTTVKAVATREGESAAVRFEPEAADLDVQGWAKAVEEISNSGGLKSLMDGLGGRVRTEAEPPGLVLEFPAT